MKTEESIFFKIIVFAIILGILLISSAVIFDNVPDTRSKPVLEQKIDMLANELGYEFERVSYKEGYWKLKRKEDN